MNNEDFLIILKSIKVLLSKNAWFEAKEYTQIEIENLENTLKKEKKYGTIKKNIL